MPAEQAKPSECQPVIAPFDVWRCSFTDAIAAGISSDWDLLVKGAGMTVSQTGGNALITTGTTANEEVIIRSKRTWEGAFAARWKATLSQRIANNTFVFEFADLIGDGLAYTINSATSVTVTVPNYPATVTPYFTAANVGQTVTLGNIRTAAGAILTTAPPQDGVIASVSGNAITFTVAGFPASGTGTLMLYGWNSYRGTYDSTTATNMKWETRRKGYTTALGAFTCSTTASPGHFVEARTTAVNAQIADTSGTLSTTSQFTTRAVRLENLPDPGVDMYMFIRAVNGTTNPATTTTMTVAFAGVEVVGRVDTPMIQTATPVGPVGNTVSIVGYPTAAAAADAYANPTITHIGADTMRFNGTTWDRGRSSSNAADGLATAATGNDNSIAFSFAFNGTTWDRVRSGTNASDAVATVATGNANTLAYNLVFNGTTYDRLRSTSNAADGVATASAGNANTIGFTFAFNGTTFDRVRSSSNAADGVATVATGNLNAAGYGFLFNGTTWDRARGNWNVATGDTGAKTTTGNGATQTNYDAVGAVVTIVMGAVTGTTPTFVGKLQMSQDSGTTWVDIPGAATATINASGNYTLTIYPGSTVVANQSVSLPLPRTWRVAWTIGGTTPSFTITSINVSYIRG